MSLARNLENPDTLQSAAPEAALTEFDLGYYGWRVVLAACLGVMAGFGSLFVYTFSVFVKPLGCGIRLEPRSHLTRLRNCRRHAGRDLPLPWPIDRSLRSSPHHSVCMTIYVLCHCFAVAIALWTVAVLRDLFWLGFVGNGAAHLAYS